MSKPTSQTELEWLREQLADQQRQLNAVNAKLERLGEAPTSGENTPVSSRGRSLAQAQSPSPKVGRRRLLRGLAAGMLGGTTLALSAKGGEAQAKFVAANGAGAMVLPPGGTTKNTLPPGISYGLITPLTLPLIWRASPIMPMLAWRFKVIIMPYSLWVTPL
jgi:hypothetical protein